MTITTTTTASTTSIQVELAFRACAKIAADHPAYELISEAVPGEFRRDLVCLFAFVQTVAEAATREGKRAELDDIEDKLTRCYYDEADEPLFIALLDVVERRDFPIAPLLDVIAGFRLQSRTRRFATHSELHTYLRLTAVPIGQIVLFLGGIHDATAHRYAESFCLALGEAAMWRDIDHDARLGRVCIPLEDLYHFGVSETEITGRRDSQAVRELIRYEVSRTRAMFDRARPLLRFFSGDIAFGLESILLDGTSTIDDIERSDYRVFSAPRRRRATTETFGLMTPWGMMGGNA
jgi:phytoene/squalene synthetase